MNSKCSRTKLIKNNYCSICFDFVERTKFRSILLPIPATLLPKNGNNVEATFDFVERIFRLVSFDNVASTLLLVWTGLYVTEIHMVDRGAKSNHRPIFLPDGSIRRQKPRQKPDIKQLL